MPAKRRILMKANNRNKIPPTPPMVAYYIHPNMPGHKLRPQSKLYDHSQKAKCYMSITKNTNIAFLITYDRSNNERRCCKKRPQKKRYDYILRRLSETLTRAKPNYGFLIAFGSSRGNDQRESVPRRRGSMRKT
jgi:hypothetical protein